MSDPTIPWPGPKFSINSAITALIGWPHRCARPDSRQLRSLLWKVSKPCSCGRLLRVRFETAHIGSAGHARRFLHAGVTPEDQARHGPHHPNNRIADRTCGRTEPGGEWAITDFEADQVRLHLDVPDTPTELRRG